MHEPILCRTFLRNTEFRLLTTVPTRVLERLYQHYAIVATPASHSEHGHGQTAHEVIDNSVPSATRFDLQPVIGGVTTCLGISPMSTPYCGTSDADVAVNTDQVDASSMKAAFRLLNSNVSLQGKLRSGLVFCVVYIHYYRPRCIL